MTHRQQAFLHAYLSTAKGNTTKAAIEAGYSSKSAQRIGYRLLRLPAISAAIESRLAKSELTVSETIDAFARLIRAPTPEKVSASDIIAAGTVFLRHKGALNDKNQSQGVHVTIGFFAQPGELQTRAHATVRVSNEPRSINSHEEAIDITTQSQNASASPQTICLPRNADDAGE